MASLPSMSSTATSSAGPSAAEAANPFINNASFVVGGSGRQNTNAQASAATSPTSVTSAPDTSSVTSKAGPDWMAYAPALLVGAVALVAVIALARRG